MFRSKLFSRIFLSTAVVIILLFTVLYLLSVPYLQATVKKTEENAARTILNNVYAMVEQTQFDLDNYRQSVTLERKEQLRNILSVVDARIVELLSQVRSESMSREQAKRTLLAELRRIKYGRNDYIWASDYRSVLISHPDPKLNNADFSKTKDSKGNLIVPPMIEMAIKGAGDGYYSYWWRRLGEEQPVEKITYFKRVPEFDIVIGTGVYLDDVDNMVQAKKSIAIDGLRERLRHVKIAKTGYIYIFDSQYVMQIHPNSNIEYTNVSLILDQETKQPLFKMLAGIADKEQSLKYLWDKPSDPGNYRYEKLSWVRYCKDFDWYICSSAYLDELGASALTLRNRMLAIFFTTLLLSLLLTYLLVTKLTAPLLEMRDTALRVIDGNLDARCLLHRDDEIGTVAMAFDSMVERLQQNIELLDTKVAGRTSELEKAYLELKEVDQVKSDILSTISHELRTPMTSVVGFVKQVKKKLETAVFPKIVADDKTGGAIKQINSNLDIIVNESERFSRLINDVLYCSTLEAGKVDWQYSIVTVAQLVKRAVDIYQPLAKQKGLILNVELAPDLPDISGDENRLYHVLNNLVSNAVKFTETGQITIKVDKQDGSLVFAVKDTGCGVATENQRNIFDKFRQIGDTLTAKPDGAGLGLSICRQIIEHHGGKIWLKSALHEGSTFFFSLPIQRT